MIKNTLKSYNSDNRGSAIITGLVVSTVLMVLCLSLLLVAYSLFFSTSQSTSDLPNREMLYSAAEAIEHELLDYTLIYEDGTEPALPTDRNLWKYVYENIWKGFNLSAENKYIQDLNSNYWLYFDSNDPTGNHNDLEKCSKYFYLTSIGSAKIIVQLYWELPVAFDETNIENKDGTLLNAIYKLYDNKGILLVKTDRKYLLSYKTTEGSGSEDDNFIVESASMTEPDGGTHSWDFVFDNANIKLLDYHTQNRGNLVITNNTSQVTNNWSFDINFKTVDSFEITSGACACEKLSGGWYQISPNGGWNNDLTLNCNYNISFIYTGTIDPSTIMRKVNEENSSQNNGNTDAKTESLTATQEYTDDRTIKITIHNNLERDIENWSITFNHNGYNFDVENGISHHSSQTITITNKDDNGHIEKDGSIDVIIKFKGNGNNNVISTLVAYTTIEAVAPPTNTKIKWTRIGEDVINPGGGN